MDEKLLLYLDILGFSDLVSKPSEVKELYEIVDNLNVFLHKPQFECIVFSDTMLIYNSFPLTQRERERERAIMWMCEFAQDLFYRLIGRDLHFRALLTEGKFEHSQLKNIQAFFGEALVQAYNYESKITATGLFMDKRLVPHSDIFKTDPYDAQYDYVHLMQTLGGIEFLSSTYPIEGWILKCTEDEYFLAYDFTYLRNIHRHMINPNLPGPLRAKYITTWQLIRSRYAKILDALEANNFDPSSIASLDWTEPMRRVGTPDGYHG
ncbi:MAG: hypothetical protein KBF68_03780 [Nitrosomonas sp.]|nr:hypothetical protein [Nitrosomonas sp.]